MLIQFICLKCRSGHQFARESLIEIGLDLLAQFAKALTIQVEFAREARGAFTFGNPTQQQQNGCRPVACLLEDAACQDGVGTLASTTAVGWKGGVSTE